jgi:hypothetical protein
VVVAGDGVNRIPLPESELLYEVRWNPGIARFREVAIGRSPDETSVARWIEPADGFAVRGDRRGREALLAAASSTASMAAMPPAVSVMMKVSFLSRREVTPWRRHSRLPTGRALTSSVGSLALSWL